jgi:hypothetical protein
MPARYAPILLGFIRSALMSFLVSAIATFLSAGLSMVLQHLDQRLTAVLADRFPVVR